MDIKTEAEKVFKTLTGDSAKLDSFKKDPIALVKSLLGDTLNDETIKKIIAEVTKLLANEKSGGILDKVKGILGK